MSEDLHFENSELVLDGTKIQWHYDRVKAWEEAKNFTNNNRFSIDRSCNYGCHFALG